MTPFEKAHWDRDMAAYHAMGILRVLLEYDQVPQTHVTQAKKAIASYEEANSRMDALMEKAA